MPGVSTSSPPPGSVQLPRRRRVPAAAVVPDLAGRRDGVRTARSPGSTCPRRTARPSPPVRPGASSARRVQPLAGDRADRQHLDAERRPRRPARPPPATSSRRADLVRTTTSVAPLAQATAGNARPGGAGPRPISASTTRTSVEVGRDHLRRRRRPATVDEGVRPGQDGDASSPRSATQSPTAGPACRSREEAPPACTRSPRPPKDAQPAAVHARHPTRDASPAGSSASRAGRPARAVRDRSRPAWSWSRLIVVSFAFVRDTFLQLPVAPSDSDVVRDMRADRVAGGTPRALPSPPSSVTAAPRRTARSTPPPATSWPSTSAPTGRARRPRHQGRPPRMPSRARNLPSPPTSPLPGVRRPPHHQEARREDPHRLVRRGLHPGRAEDPARGRAHPANRRRTPSTTGTSASSPWARWSPWRAGAPPTTGRSGCSPSSSTPDGPPRHGLPMAELVAAELRRLDAYGRGRAGGWSSPSSRPSCATCARLLGEDGPQIIQLVHDDDHRATGWSPGPGCARSRPTPRASGPAASASWARTAVARPGWSTRRTASALSVFCWTLRGGERVPASSTCGSAMPPSGTENARPRPVSCSAMGVDGLITDSPDHAARAVAELLTTV